MKKFLAVGFLLVTASAPVSAAEKLIPFTDANTYFQGAVGKTVSLRFSDGFTKAHGFASADMDGLTVSEVAADKICFYGHDGLLDPEDAKLKDVARAEQLDVCIPRSEISVRYEPVVVEGAPPSPFYASDRKACTWAYKKGSGIAIWAEDCTYDSQAWIIKYDDKNEAFNLTTEGSDPFPILRQFHKKVEEGPEVLLPGLRKAGLIPDDNECQFAPYTAQAAPPGWSFVEIVPTGKRKQDFDSLADDEVPDPPCGEIGYAVDYVGFFMIPDAHKDRVLYIDLGQDSTVFDPGTISLF